MLIRNSLAVAVAVIVAGSSLVADEVQPEARSLFVEGYTDQLSYQPGEKVRFHVSTTAPKWSLEIARLGAKTESVFTKNDIAGTAYPVPANASSHGCHWPVSFELTVPDEWRSGYYEATLRVGDNGGDFTQRGRRSAESKLFFVVRPAHPGANSKTLLQLATTRTTLTTTGAGTACMPFTLATNCKARACRSTAPWRASSGNGNCPSSSGRSTKATRLIMP